MKKLNQHSKKRYQTIAVSALAALWLTACGGGGGDDAPAAPTPGGGDVVAVNPPPSGGTTNPVPPPPPPAAPAPVALSWAATSAPADQYHTVASSDNGSVLVAGTITNAGGRLLLSTNSGTSFAPTNAPAGSWISVDMTPTGNQIVAAQFIGGLYRSTNSGAAWSRIDGTTDPRGYESVSTSEDGTRIVAVTKENVGGSIFFSENGTAATPTFAAATLVGGGALSDSFRWIDSSANGNVVVAVSQNGTVYQSVTGGRTFSPLRVEVAGREIRDGWYRVAMSDDGNRIALAGSTRYGEGVPAAERSSGLYIGNRNAAGTWTWTRGSTVTGEYTSLSMTGNGAVIAATLSDTSTAAGAPATGPGQILVSSNGGQSFSARTAPAGETNWRSIALNATATRAFLAAGEFLTTNGRLYLSSGSLVD